MGKSAIDRMLEEVESEAAAKPAPAGPRAASGEARPASAGLGAPLPASAGDDALASLSAPAAASAAARKTVEDILVANGALPLDKLVEARSVQATSRGKKISQILLEMGAIKEDDVQRALAEVLGLPFETIEFRAIERRVFEHLPTDFMKNRGCCGMPPGRGDLDPGHGRSRRRFPAGGSQAPRHAAKRSGSSSSARAHINIAIEAANAAGQRQHGEKFDEIIKDMGQEELEIVAEEEGGGHRPGQGVRRKPGHPPRQLPDFRRDQAGGLATSTSSRTKSAWWSATASTACCSRR